MHIVVIISLALIALWLWSKHSDRIRTEEGLQDRFRRSEEARERILEIDRAQLKNETDQAVAKQKRLELWNIRRREREKESLLKSLYYKYVNPN